MNQYYQKQKQRDLDQPMYLVVHKVVEIWYVVRALRDSRNSGHYVILENPSISISILWHSVISVCMQAKYMYTYLGWQAPVIKIGVIHKEITKKYTRIEDKI